MCLSCELVHTRLIGLETFWNASLRVEIKVKKISTLLVCFPVHGQQMLSSLILPIKK